MPALSPTYAKMIAIKMCALVCFTRIRAILPPMMRRYLNRSNRHTVGLEYVSEKAHDVGDDNASSVVGHGSSSTTALLTPSATLPPPNLKIKRLDYYYSRWSKSWKYKNMGDKVTPEMTIIGASSSGNDPWQSYCFVVIRTLSRSDEDPVFQVVIKSSYLVEACKDVIQTIPGISWTAEPLQASV